MVDALESARSAAGAVGVDIGGTKLLALAVAEGGRVVARKRLPTPRADPAMLLEVVARAASEVGPGLPVGVGVAGIVSRGGVLRYGPNLQVHDLDLRAELARRLGVPVTVQNDATVAAYGELRAGAARGVNDAVLLTLGTGVGGGIVVDGRLLIGANGMGAELGHVVVLDGGRRCPCGNLGCLEAYASGTAIGRRAVEVLSLGEVPSSLREVEVVDARSVTAAAVAGDQVALTVLREAGYWLGVGLVSIVNALDPQLVVLGGGAAPGVTPFMVPEAERVVTARILGAAHRSVPAIVGAELGDDAGAVGAALLALDQPVS